MKKLDIIYEVKGMKIDEGKRTVISGVLEEDIISSNDRFYPASVVREAINTLPGKRSLIGHESNSPEDIVAKIVESGMEGKVGYASFKFGSDSRSEMMFQKVKEGLVNSVSIRASGETKRGKIGEKFVDVVEKLDIYSVDWVVEGGIPSARVVQVYEQSPTINYDHELTEEEKSKMDELEKVKKELAEANAKIEELTKQLAEKDLKVKEANDKLVDLEMESYRTTKLVAISDKDVREFIRPCLAGKTKEEIDAQFKEQVTRFEFMKKKAGVKEEFIIAPVDGDKSKDLKFSSVNEIFDSKEVKKEDKVNVLKSLM